MSLSIESRCIHLEGDDPAARYGAISFPIYQTATFAHPALGESTGYDYSRVQNPTRQQLEKTVAALEQGTDAVAFSTGMAAILAVMELFAPGDHIVTEADLYGGTPRLFHTVSEPRGITFTTVNFSDGTAQVAAAIHPETKALYIETPTNPMMRVTDIRKAAELAHAHGALLIVDNTFLSPYLQNPLTLGADIVVHSGTKYLSGHNDTLAGFAVVKDAALAARLREISKTIGANLAPFDAWLLLRGIQTLAVRMDRAEENAMALAQWLKTRPEVTRVIYPGLPEHPGHALMKQQARGFGAMLTFEVRDKREVPVLLKAVRLIRFAESLGGTESLLTYPITQTHADVPPEVLAANGLTDRILRLSVGIENINDLRTDLEQAFAAVQAAL
ncbi:PLP-dependent aspartate aminotransferase family protein [uncultured Gemmiger sp.]|uniref:trans-sulfuration enzyme family protein n=1 Tax=uncultured Gemmiger sp. TaxID=1623490 RepID=UPI0025E249EC|nr:PLP-dependent aspartate aminotransferase family protein [uncultured Gemmiger sp.]MBS6782239.1 PLP-dependent transferase [Subdoligranulum variabile]